MLVWEGNLIYKKYRQHFLLSEIEEDVTIAVTSKMFIMEMRAVETLIDADHQYDGRPRPVFTPSPRKVYQLSIVLVSISLALDDALLCNSLRFRSEMGKFKYSIGSTNGMTRQFLVDNNTEATEPSTNDDLSVDSTDMLDEFYVEAIKVNIYIYYILVSIAHASRPKGIDASHLSKICRINLDSAKRTLEITYQHRPRNNNPTLSRNFGTNNRMLQYKRIKEHFFMDTLFSAKTMGKSSWGNTCFQLSITDKGLV